MASGGVYGQPVWGGAELQWWSTTAHTQPLLQPLVQPFLQPLMQPSSPAGWQHKVARLWEIYFYGERDALCVCTQHWKNHTLKQVSHTCMSSWLWMVEPCERLWPDCMASLLRGIGTFGLPPTRLYLQNKADYVIMNRASWQLLLKPDNSKRLIQACHVNEMPLMPQN